MSIAQDLETIPLVDLRAQVRGIRAEIDAAIAGVLESAAFILGPAVSDFETKFAAFTGTRHAVGVNSGTSALHLALLAAGVGPGDEVIAPAMTFVATAAAIEYTGARPVLVDVEPVTYTLDPAGVEAAITPRTRSIVPVHLYGQCAAMEPILAIARRHGLVVVEDAAQAHGADDGGRRAGGLGDLAAFSFYPGKNLGAYGEGGAVTSDRDDLAAAVRSLRDWGQEGRGNHVLRGFNYRLEGIQGAILGVKMRHIEAWTEARRRAAARYRSLLSGVAGVALPSERPGARHVYHLFAVRVRDRRTVAERLAAEGIATGVHYPLPLHLQPCYRDLGYHAGDFPVAERLAAEELSLPLFPELTGEQIERVAAALTAAVRAS
jgi:dTDP-4-amino-4,6-dideoxygalactose transaminase